MKKHKKGIERALFSPYFIVIFSQFIYLFRKINIYLFVYLSLSINKREKTHGGAWLTSTSNCAPSISVIFTFPNYQKERKLRY